MNKILDEFTNKNLTRMQKWRLRHPDRDKKNWMSSNRKRSDALKTLPKDQKTILDKKEAERSRKRREKNPL